MTQEDNMKLQAQMISDQMKMVKKLSSIKHKIVVMSRKGGSRKDQLLRSISYLHLHIKLRRTSAFRMWTTGSMSYNT